MAYRFTSVVAIAVGGSSIAHGLGPLIPDEITVLSTIATAAGQTYRFSATDATNIYLANGTAAGSAYVIARLGHSIIV